MVGMAVQRRPVLFVVSATGLILILFVFAGVGFQWRDNRQVILDTMTAVAEFVADVSASSLASQNYAAVQDTLTLLHKNKRVQTCRIYSSDGYLFASYSRFAGKTVPMLVKEGVGTRYSFFKEDGESKLELIHPIFLGKERVGTLLMVSSEPEKQGVLWRFLTYRLGWVFVVVVVLVYAVSSSFRKAVVKPLHALTGSVKDIVNSGDFSARLKGELQEDVDSLADALNTLLDAIQERDTRIAELEDDLEDDLVERVRERTEKLTAVRDQALAVAEARGEYLAHMSHEIRTPLNGVIGVLSLLEDDSMSEENKILLETATRSADSLLLIINDILDFSKIEAGKIDFEAVPFNLRDVVEETVTLIADMANGKELELICDISINIHPHVVGDPTRLHQIITNLVGNAVKFTDRGEVVLRVSMLGEKEGKQMFHFSVKDTGIGIPVIAQETLFDKFTQADDSTTRKYGGTGLGLSVCKMLVELQEGEIGLHSEEGRGTLFWFTLPMQLVEGDYPVVPCERLDHKNILIVDDNTTRRKILEKYLHVCKTRIFTCDRADRAMVLLRDLGKTGVSVDSLLIDYGLPGKNGLQLANEIVIIYGDNSPKIHLLSSDRGLTDSADTDGVQSIIHKPVRQFELYEALTCIAQPERSTKEEEKTLIPPMRMRGRILLVDDEPVNQMVGVMLLQKLGLEVEVATGGREAIQMFQDNVYDLILMDLSMPEMSGFEATKEIRRLEGKKGLPRMTIIALTANALQSIQERCMEEGMDDFISKPVKPEFLAERLQLWLAVDLQTPIHEETKGSLLTAAFLSGEDGGEKSWDVEQALQFVSGDEELLCELMSIFLTRNKPLMDDIDEAIKNGDPSALCDAAHAYKGAVNHFSAVKVSSLAQTIEDMGRKGEISEAESLVGQLKEHVSPLVASLKRATTQHC